MVALPQDSQDSSYSSPTGCPLLASIDTACSAKTCREITHIHKNKLVFKLCACVHGTSTHVVTQLSSEHLLSPHQPPQYSYFCGTEYSNCSCVQSKYSTLDLCFLYVAQASLKVEILQPPSGHHITHHVPCPGGIFLVGN